MEVTVTIQASKLNNQTEKILDALVNAKVLKSWRIKGTTLVIQTLESNN